MFSGSSPMGSTQWQPESDKSIFVDVNFDHLGLSTPPAVITRLLHRGGIDFNDPIANVTGFFTPRKITKSGFRLRLKYADGDLRNMTVSHAKIADWRVGWVAVTSKHPALQDKNAFEQKVALFKLFLEEDPQLIRLFLGQDYFPMLRNHPKPQKPFNNTSSFNNTKAGGNFTKAKVENQTTTPTAGSGGEEAASAEKKTE